MSLTVEAIYSNGVLKLAEPLPLQENERVNVTVQQRVASSVLTLEEAEQRVRRSYGLIGWTGDLETLRQVAEDPDFSPWES